MLGTSFPKDSNFTTPDNTETEDDGISSTKAKIIEKPHVNTLPSQDISNPIQSTHPDGSMSITTTRTPIFDDQGYKYSCICSDPKDAIKWMIECDICSGWYHGECLNLPPQAAEEIDKFICFECEPTHGQTTYKRKSTRTKHQQIDYSEVKGAHDQHRYTKLLFDNRHHSFCKHPFPRLRPEVLNEEFVLKNGLSTPIVIPGSFGDEDLSSETEQELISKSDNAGANSSKIEQGDNPKHQQDPFAYPRDNAAAIDDIYKHLGMRMPVDRLTVPDVARYVGYDRLVDVIEVATQSEHNMALGDWSDYFTLPLEERKVIMNVISLEVSNSELANHIVRPKIVRSLDLVNKVWPRHKLVKWERDETIIDDVRAGKMTLDVIQPTTDTTESAEAKDEPEMSTPKKAATKKPKDDNDPLAMDFPRVQLYCLMSVSESYTDFHIDFGGSSVFYHLIRGEKIFYFIEPTKRNLAKYEKWSGSPDQGQRFLGDEVKDCFVVKLKAGDTMVIPSGWIHAVFTPKDSVVIGGNFLHNLSIPMQMDIYKMEKRLGVPQKFRFPLFEKLQWHTAVYFWKILRDNNLEALNTWEQAGLLPLFEFLVTHLHTLLASDDANMSLSPKASLETLPKCMEQLSLPQRRQVRKSVPGNIRDPLRFVRLFAHVLGKVEVVDWKVDEADIFGLFVENEAEKNADNEDTEKKVKTITEANIVGWYDENGKLQKPKATKTELVRKEKDTKVKKEVQVGVESPDGKRDRPKGSKDNTDKPPRKRTKKE